MAPAPLCNVVFVPAIIGRNVDGCRSQAGGRGEDLRAEDNAIAGTPYGKVPEQALRFQQLY